MVIYLQLNILMVTVLVLSVMLLLRKGSTTNSFQTQPVTKLTSEYVVVKTLMIELIKKKWLSRF